MPVIGYGVSRTKDRRRQRYGAHTHEQPVQMCWARRVQAVRAARGWPCRRRRTHLCGGHVCRRWSSRVVVGFVCSLRLRSASSVYSVDRSSQAFAGSHGSVAQLQVRFGADPDPSMGFRNHDPSRQRRRQKQNPTCGGRLARGDARNWRGSTPT